MFKANEAARITVRLMTAATALALLMTSGAAQAEIPFEIRFHPLFAPYATYGYVQYCHTTREGYASVYINDVEMDRAKLQIKAIEAPSIAENGGAAGDAFRASLFRTAIQTLNGRAVSYEECRLYFGKLFRDFPVKDGGGIKIEKDF